MRSRVPQKPFARPKSAPSKTHRPIAGIRPSIFYGAVAVLLLTNVVTGVCFLMAPDIARLISGQNDGIYAAYEDRIAQLRLDVDRLHSRQYAQAGDINLQLQELSQQQEVLSEQHEYVKQLATMAEQLGLKAADATSATTAEPTGLKTSEVLPPADPRAEVENVAGEVRAMMEESRTALAALSGEATGRTDAILDALAEIGIKPKMPEADTAVGGPLLAPIDGLDSDLIIDEANGVMAALERFKAARAAAEIAPVYKPVVASRISSTYGNRKDPFTGRYAFHSGIDFAAPSGTTVTAAGAGKVTFVGQISGYGNVVEITHASGLITRYGHLSSFIAKEGDIVSTGTPIARVGSTGRSTGPHLHFEVRRADNAVDPARYLAVGRELAKLLG